MEHNGREWLSEFGERLRNEREKQSLTRAKLAELADTDSSYLIQIEKGMKAPSIGLLRNFLLALGASADYMLFGVNKDDEQEQCALQGVVGFLEKRSTEDIETVCRIIKLIFQLKERESKHN